MESSLLSSFVGTTLELSIIFSAFYLLLEIKKEKLLGYLGIFLLLVVMIVELNIFIPVYAAFIYIFATIFLVKLYTKENFFKVLFVFILTMVGVMLGEILLIPASIFLPFPDTIKMIFIIGFLNILIVGVFYRFRENFVGLVQKYETKYVNFMALNAFIYMFVFKIIWEYNSEVVTQNFFYFGLVIVILIVVNYFIYKEVTKITEKSRVHLVQEGMRETLESMINDIRMKQHEFKNHLTTIQGFVDTSSPEDAVHMIGTYLDEVHEYEAIDEELLNIDRNIIKAVMFTKQSEALDRGIEFDFSVQSNFDKVPVLDYELSTILNNLLNNAFEAVQSKDNKRVKLVLGYDEALGQHYFMTKNDGSGIKPEMVSKLTEKHFTTKKNDVGSHGFGLSNISKIVKKYRGLIYVYFDQGDIVFKVTF